ncbi:MULTISPECIES: methyl-accepting chemotaxis protein [unclassified Duganella]|uniref:methyl-accepting chemotaxis protein n=1 Tax=unclassified Duganella TaxID=2636909 RepID=UPI00088956A8|nr:MULTISPECIES: methyl-accepting chemotaxis protein [unclassified Duganella]SDG71912.1 methyl-accepting chemotaxis protein [Duganella sp. OV458]SDJ97782.1 methyl-accepting chemotaxis protein [Duganella sp. OV510]
MKNLKIGTRLAAGFGLVLALMILMTVIGIRHMHSVAVATNEMMQQPLAKERMISDWYRLIHTSVRRTSAISKSTDPSLGAYFADDTKQSVAEINKLQKSVEELIDGDEEKTLYAKLKDYRKLYGESRDKIVALKKEGKLDEAAEELEQRFTPAGKAYLGNLSALLEHQRKNMDNQAQRIDALYESNRSFMAGLGVVVLALGVFCAWRLTRGITVPLGQAVQIAEAVAHRDLTSHIEVDSTDETGRLLQSLQKMNDGLIDIVSQVRDGTESISTASNQIAAGNLDLSGRTEEQASSLEETASSMEELTATVKQNADNARQANQLAVKASEVAQRGGGVVSEVVSTMEAINGSSRKIADIISVIDGIAFQTNILALNAAVEAARAGEQGRGFAVVASEVRNLAQRSAAAAKEIKVLIDDSLDKVDAGSMLVTQAGTTMTEVVDSIQRVTDIMGEITSATNEQSSGIEQVNQAIGQMDQVTQQNAALVEEAAAAAASLHDQADALTAIVAVFKLHDSHTPRAPQRLQLT